MQIPFPDKKYDIIYADPPWHFNDDQLSANYQSMDYFQICYLLFIRSQTTIACYSYGLCLLNWIRVDSGQKLGVSVKTVAFVWENKRATPAITQ